MALHIICFSGAGRVGYMNGSFCATFRVQENKTISHKILSDMANKLDPMDILIALCCITELNSKEVVRSFFLTFRYDGIS